MHCDSDEWTADPEEVKYVELKAEGQFAKLKAIVTIGYRDEVDPWLIGQAAWLAWGEKKGSGFSPGATTDELTRRKNFASGASKALHKWNINKLKTDLNCFREGTFKPESVSWQQMIVRCDELIITGSASESLRAIDMKMKMTGKQDTPSAGESLKPLIAQVGVERARRGLKEFGMERLIHGVPELFKNEDYDDGKSGSDAGRAGDDAGNHNGGGLRRTGDDATAKVDERFGNVDGTDAGERSDGCREVDGRLTLLEAPA